MLRLFCVGLELACFDLTGGRAWRGEQASSPGGSTGA